MKSDNTFYMTENERLAALVRLYVHYHNRATFYAKLYKREKGGEAEKRANWNAYCRLNNLAINPLKHILTDLWDVKDVELRPEGALVSFNGDRLNQLITLSEEEE